MDDAAQGRQGFLDFGKGRGHFPVAAHIGFEDFGPGLRKSTSLF